MVRTVLLAFATLAFFLPHASAQSAFTLEQIMSAPFPEHLTASKTGCRLAWTLDREGRRNIWVAEGPGFQARPLTNYDADDGQELADVHFSSDGNTVVYVRGEGKKYIGAIAQSDQQSCGRGTIRLGRLWNSGGPGNSTWANSGDFCFGAKWPT